MNLPNSRERNIRDESTLKLINLVFLLQYDKKVIIDVGANKGSFILDIAQKNREITCLAIEPIQELATGIEDSAKKLQLTNLEVESVAVYKKRKTMILNINSHFDQGTTSLLDFDRANIEENSYWITRPDLTHDKKVSVSADTMKNILRRYPKGTPIEFIKIDAQGLDVEALLSLGNRLKSVLLGMVEVPAVDNSKLYLGQRHDLYSCLKILKKRGFHVYGVKPNDPASNEFNIYFARVGVDYAKLVENLGLATNEIYNESSS
jgi:FkbM family methyltransferase